MTDGHHQIDLMFQVTQHPPGSRHKNCDSCLLRGSGRLVLFNYLVVLLNAHRPQLPLSPREEWALRCHYYAQLAPASPMPAGSGGRITKIVFYIVSVILIQKMTSFWFGNNLTVLCNYFFNTGDVLFQPKITWKI